MLNKIVWRNLFTIFPPQIIKEQNDAKEVHLMKYEGINMQITLKNLNQETFFSIWEGEKRKKERGKKYMPDAIAIS